VDHLKPYTGRNLPSGWEHDISEFTPDFEELPEENLLDDSEDFNISDDLHNSIEVPHFDTPEARVDTPPPFQTEFVTPARRTRCGRSVRKPIKFSPSL